MRHLKSNAPFERIVFKNKRVRSKSTTAQQRSYSAKQRVPEGLTNEKVREELERNEPKYQTKDNFYTDDKYANYKHEVIHEFQKERSNLSDKKDASPVKSRQVHSRNEQVVQNEALRRSKYER
jgi:hypothetical protein